MSKRPHPITAADQLDFWPELRHKSMVHYAALATRRAPARSVSEDGRAACSVAARWAVVDVPPLGNTGGTTGRGPRHG